jgi:predicted DNA-binding ribbon-helix-helix protein
MPETSAESQSRQRILQRHGRRLSIRLEEVFWTQLETCANEDGIKLADLVFNLTESGRQPENRSSLLRAYCVDWLRKRLFQARLSASQIDIQLILSACPVPCVIITQQRKLAAHNPAFVRDVLDELVPVAERQQKADTVVRLSLSKPFELIADNVRTSGTGYAESGLTFISGENQATFRGRFCLLSRRLVETAPLLCFLQPTEAPR